MSTMVVIVVQSVCKCRYESNNCNFHMLDKIICTSFFISNSLSSVSFIKLIVLLFHISLKSTRLQSFCNIKNINRKNQERKQFLLNCLCISGKNTVFVTRKPKFYILIQKKRTCLNFWLRENTPKFSIPKSYQSEIEIKSSLPFILLTQMNEYMVLRHTLTQESPILHYKTNT